MASDARSFVWWTHRTKTGRVVYDRPRNRFRYRDLFRLCRSLENPDVIGFALEGRGPDEYAGEFAFLGLTQWCLATKVAETTVDGLEAFGRGFAGFAAAAGRKIRSRAIIDALPDSASGVLEMILDGELRMIRKLSDFVNTARQDGLLE